MAYSVINKTGCCERKGHPQIRFDMFLEPDDARYEETYVQVPVVPTGGYPNKVDKEGNPVDQKDYDLWHASLPRIWRVNPFHSHFIGYYPHDFTDSQLKSDMDFHLANFYKAYQDGWDKVAGGMRHGFAVEKRIIPINYAKTLEVAEYKAVQTQVINRLNRLDEFKQTPIKLDDGKVYPATTIDVGSEAVAGDSISDMAGCTRLNLNNPANGTGTLDTFELWAFTDITSPKVGTFYGSGTSWTYRDYESIGTIASGLKRTFSGLEVVVETNDVVGIFATGGNLAGINTSEGDGYGFYASDGFTAEAKTYSIIDNRILSIYATGETTGLNIAPPSITSTLTLGTAKINLNIAGSGIASTTAVGSHTVTVGAVNIAPAGIVSTISIGAVTITQGLKLYPSSITSTVVIGSPILSYDQTITPNGISSAIAFGDAVIVHVSHILPAGIAGTATIGIPELTRRIIPPPATKYAIELRTAAGALKQIFEAAYGASYTQVVNGPHTLTFNLRGTDPKRSDIRWPYEFWLRNMVTGSVVKKFILTGESDSDSRNNLTTQINASSLLAQLGMETLQSDLTITGTVSAICTAILSHQRLTPAITLGTIEITTEVSMSWTGHPTLLACINNLLDAVGGYPDVNDDRELDWLDDVGEDKGQQIRQGKNIVALKQDIDWMSFATVLYPVGNSIKLSDKTVTMEVATKSAGETYGYLTLPTDYVCFDEATLDILRKGTKEDLAAFDVIANISPGTDWTVVAGVSASWDYPKLADGNDTSSRLGFRWATARWFSGLDFRVTQFNQGFDSQTRIRRIVIEYTTNAFTTILPAWDSGVVYDLGDGANAFDVDFGQRFYGNGLAITIYAYTPIGGVVADYIAVVLSSAYPPKGTIEFFDESESWTNINGRQLSIPIASYHADDTYYLTYTLADYLKDLTAIATWSDEDGNGGEVSRSQTFNYADDVDTLLQWGQVYLPTVSYPPTTYHLQAALLNEVHANFSFDELQKGSIVAVVHDDLGITVNARVLRINQPDLFNSPAEADIDISSQPKTLADAFRALWDRI